MGPARGAIALLAAASVTCRAPTRPPQAGRCTACGVDVTRLEIGHVAVRCRTWVAHPILRDALEAIESTNRESVKAAPPWTVQLAEPERLPDGRSVPVIELIGPFYQRVHVSGLEHIGYVVDSGLNAFKAERPQLFADHHSQGSGPTVARPPLPGLHARRVPRTQPRHDVPPRRSPHQVNARASPERSALVVCSTSGAEPTGQAAPDPAARPRPATTGLAGQWRSG
jgi:hypothetical protein